MFCNFFYNTYRFTIEFAYHRLSRTKIGEWQMLHIYHRFYGTYSHRWFNIIGTWTFKVPIDDVYSVAVRRMGPTTSTDGKQSSLPWKKRFERIIALSGLVIRALMLPWTRVNGAHYSTETLDAAQYMITWFVRAILSKLCVPFSFYISLRVLKWNVILILYFSLWIFGRFFNNLFVYLFITESIPSSIWYSVCRAKKRQVKPMVRYLMMTYYNMSRQKASGETSSALFDDNVLPLYNSTRKT